MKIIMVRYKVKPEHVSENEDALKEVFTNIENEKPVGIHYASFKLADGVSFVALVHLEEGATPLTEYPYFQKFQSNLMGIVDGQPEQEILDAIGTYNFLG